MEESKVEKSGPITVANTIASARVDNFNALTKLGNKVASELNVKSTGEEPDNVVQAIRKHVPEFLQMSLEIILQKAKLWPVIEKSPDLAYFTNINYSDWVTPKDWSDEEILHAKVI